MFAEKVIEESAEGVALVVAEHRLAVESLPHLFDEQGSEHAFEGPADGVWRGLLSIYPM